MAAADGGAALPWAAQPAEEAVVIDLPVTMGLQLGSRVEVMWSIHQEGEGGAEVETNKARAAAHVEACSLKLHSLMDGGPNACSGGAQCWSGMPRARPMAKGARCMCSSEWVVGYQTRILHIS